MDNTFAPDLNGRNIDVVSFLGRLSRFGNIHGIIPYTKTRRDFRFRAVLTAITDSQTLMSSIEYDSTDFICSNLNNRLWELYIVDSITKISRQMKQ